jgi:hypothetical protein
MDCTLPATRSAVLEDETVAPPNGQLGRAGSNPEQRVFQTIALRNHGVENNGRVRSCSASCGFYFQNIHGR